MQGSKSVPVGLPVGLSYIIRNSGKPIALHATCLTLVFLLGLFFDTEDGGDMFL
jgi:hypothetical protein